MKALTEVLKESSELVRETGQWILQQSSQFTSSDIIYKGTNDLVQDREIKNKAVNPAKLSNVISVTVQPNNVYNDGVINYTTRHIQRSIGSLRQASLLDDERFYTYKPVLLWEVSGTENTKSINNEVNTQSAYVLSAIPLNSNLSADVPVVKNNVLINNTFSLGEAAYWITRYNGYFYSQGEIIKYDAVQYNVSGFGKNYAYSSARTSSSNMNSAADASLPTELMLSAGQTFSLVTAAALGSTAATASYNIVVIPEAG